MAELASLLRQAMPAIERFGANEAETLLVIGGLSCRQSKRKKISLDKPPRSISALFL